jgi:DNA polymerase III epsilon subunit-like protein
MRYAVIDTETSGLFDFSKPADAEGQPRLANLAVLTLNETLEVETTVNVFVKPDGWSMTPDAIKIHGLTDDILNTKGIPIKDVLALYLALIEDGFVIVGFNAQYDTKVMRGELRRAGLPDRFEDTPNVCVMRALTGVCKIPKKTGSGYKFPKLWEACKHFGIEQPEEHTAFGDATVTAELLRRLAGLGLVPEPEVHYAKNRPEQSP